MKDACDDSSKVRYRITKNDPLKIIVILSSARGMFHELYRGDIGKLIFPGTGDFQVSITVRRRIAGTNNMWSSANTLSC